MSMKHENNIKHLCKIKGITLIDLAKKTDLSVDAIRSLSCGRADINEVKYSTLKKLCIGLNCSISDLFVDRKEKAFAKKISR